MKRAIAVSLILTLLVTVSAGALSVKQVRANFSTVPFYVTMTSPQNITYTQTSIPITLWYSVLENGNHYYELDGQKLVPFTPEKTGGAYRFTLHGLSDGAHTLTVIVTGSWNWLYHKGRSTVTFTVDVAPKANILSPENKTYDSPDLPLEFVVTKTASRLAYSLDGQTNVTVVGNITLNGLGDGEHVVAVYAWDEAGNVGASEQVTFNIVKTFPTKLLAIVTIAPSAVVTIGLLAYFAKAKKNRSEALKEQ